MDKAYKLGITYSVFSGEEMLRSSILSIRNCVDYINIVYQKISWTGGKCDENLEKILYSLKNEGLINSIIEFNFLLNINTKKIPYYQCKKKNLGIRDLKRNKCTHCMIMDVDEFYIEEEFRKAKEFVYSKKITHSCCSIYDYRFTPYYRMRDIRDYAVPFIFKLTPLSYLIGKGNMPCRIDVMRTFIYIPFMHKFYYLNLVSMHHMTGIRKNYKFKTENSFTNYNKEGKEIVQKILAKHYELEKLEENELLKEGYIKVEDIFHLTKEKYE